jgi:hypothetical protein
MPFRRRRLKVPSRAEAIEVARAAGVSEATAVGTMIVADLVAHGDESGWDVPQDEVDRVMRGLRDIRQDDAEVEAIGGAAAAEDRQRIASYLRELAGHEAEAADSTARRLDAGAFSAQYKQAQAEAYIAETEARIEEMRRLADLLDLKA